MARIRTAQLSLRSPAYCFTILEKPSTGEVHQLAGEGGQLGKGRFADVQGRFPGGEAQEVALAGIRIRIRIDPAPKCIKLLMNQRNTVGTAP
jgi:hypothetical protein